MAGRLTKLVPLMLEVPKYRTGGANLRSPTGGFAYGIPRYSETSAEGFDDACPLTEPLDVLIVFTAACLACRAL
jgi:hypothetical protein